MKNNGLHKITGLWNYKDHKGGEYLTANVSKKYLRDALEQMEGMEEPKIMIYPYTLEDGKNKGPDFVLYICEGKKKEKEGTFSKLTHQKNTERRGRYDKDAIYDKPQSTTGGQNNIEDDGEFPY